MEHALEAARQLIYSPMYTPPYQSMPGRVSVPELQLFSSCLDRLRKLLGTWTNQLLSEVRVVMCGLGAAHTDVAWTLRNVAEHVVAGGMAELVELVAAEVWHS